MEEKKRDLENKLIQERLKCDQKTRDYQKLDENYKEARQNLAEQIETTKEKLKKIDHLENELSITTKKMKEFKKSSKKLNLKAILLEKTLKDQTDKKEKLELSIKEKYEEIENKLNNESK